MYQNNYYNGMSQYGAQFGVGVPTRPNAKFTQPLTPEVISKLRSTGDILKIEVSQEDLWRAACTHKENGNITLVSDGINPDTGRERVHCTICGKAFDIVEADAASVNKTVDEMINLLQNAKLMYLDASPELIKQYFQMLPLLELFPKMYERSQKNFDQYAMAQGMVPGNTAVGTNGFAMMNGMLQNPYMAAYGYGYQTPAPVPQPNPYMGQVPMQQPMMPQQPNMMYGGAPQFAGNPFMYNGAPMQQPVAAPAPAPAAGTVPPAVPATDDGQVSQQKTFNV